MKKLLLIAIVGMCVTSCSSTMSNDYQLSDLLGKNLLHSFLSKDTKEINDSLKSQSDKHFNFFLKEGIAKKFGL
ncbi:MAG: hypothetical protein PW786_09120 [Arachidicoccus sp.]|nr:hypothetical protein [Arachidicoccus sp.]